YCARAAEDVDAAGRNVRQDEAAIQAPEEIRGRPRVRAAGPMSEHDVDDSGPQLAKKLRDELERLLEIGCDDGDVFAAGGGEPGSNGRERSEIAAQLDELRLQPPGWQLLLEPAQ